MEQQIWSHLPNAKYIDWAFASLKANRLNWNEARFKKGQLAWDATWAKEWKPGNYEVYCSARDIIWNMTRSTTWYQRTGASVIEDDKIYFALRDTILALIVYDDCAYMIESDVGELKILAAFGDPRAALLLPACIVYNETKRLS